MNTFRLGHYNSCCSAGLVGTVFTLSVVSDLIFSILFGWLVDKYPLSRIGILLICGWIAASVPLLMVVLSGAGYFSVLFIAEFSVLQVLFVSPLYFKCSQCGVIPLFVTFFRIFLRVAEKNNYAPGTALAARNHGKAFGTHIYLVRKIVQAFTCRRSTLAWE